jgi:hypothetical protein
MSDRRKMPGGRLLGLAAVGLAILSIAPVHAETPAQFCAHTGTDDTLRPIPENLVAAVNALFHTTMPTRMAVDKTVFRCAGGHVLVCATGANLPCGKADTERTSAGGTQWCRDHPDASFIPAYATGHATIFEWRCRNGAPAIVRQNFEVDPRGFVAEFWKPLP